MIFDNPNRSPWKMDLSFIGRGFWRSCARQNSPKRVRIYETKSIANGLGKCDKLREFEKMASNICLNLPLKRTLTSPKLFVLKLHRFRSELRPKRLAIGNLSRSTTSEFQTHPLSMPSCPSLTPRLAYLQWIRVQRSANLPPRFAQITQTPTAFPV